MNPLNRAWQFLRKLPIGRWLKPLWKGPAKALIQQHRDALQEDLRKGVSAEGPKAVDRIIDRNQTALKDAVLKLSWLPGDTENRLADLIQTHGDRLQAHVSVAVERGGPMAVDAAVDGAQAILLAEIDKL